MAMVATLRSLKNATIYGFFSKTAFFTSKIDWRREGLDANEFRCVAGLQRHIHDGRGAVDIFSRKSAVFGPHFAAL